MERLRSIRSARALDFHLEDIEGILAFRDRGESPCSYVMKLLESQIDEISRWISALERLQSELRRLVEVGSGLPEDIQVKICICHALQEDRQT